MSNPSMLPVSPDINGVDAEYGNETAKKYDESLSKEMEKTKSALATEKLQNISQVVYNSVNNENLTESDYQFSNADTYDNTDFSDKTDTYVNMNTSYRYIRFNVDGAGDFYNQLGEGYNFQKDSPKKVFANLKDRFVKLGFNKKFENGSRKTVDFNSDKDFLYVIGLFQAVVEDKVDGASKKDFRVGPNTLKSLASDVRFDVNIPNNIVETNDKDSSQNIAEITSEENDKNNGEETQQELLNLDSEVKGNNSESNVDIIKNKVSSMSHKYLGELFNLDNDVEKGVFKQQRKQLESNFPKFNSDTEKDSFYNSIYYGLYDLRSKFSDPKVKKEIASLMKEYDPLFDKYDNFYKIGDKVVEKLYEEGIFGKDLNAIENFFYGEGSKENVDSSLRKNTVSWSKLTEDGEDGSAGQRTRLISAMKKLLDEGKISIQELADFKAIMFQTRDVFSNVLDGLNIPDTKQEKSVIDTKQSDNIDIDAQRKFEKPILDNVIKNRENMEKMQHSQESNVNSSGETLDDKMNNSNKEMEENKRLFDKKLDEKYDKLVKEIAVITSGKDLNSAKGMVVKLQSDVQEMVAIIDDYNKKIADNKEDYMMVAAFSGQKKSYENYLVKYKSLLSLANKKVSDLTIERAVKTEVKKSVKSKEVKETKTAKKDIESLLDIDLSKDLLSNKNLSDTEIKKIKTNIVDVPNILKRSDGTYNLNNLEDVNSLLKKINVDFLRIRRDNLIYINNRLKNIN